MNTPLVILDSEVSVADACKVMGEKHIGSILLSHREVVHGIFTERDLVSRALPQQDDSFFRYSLSTRKG
jgi:CBS domain-containing protein